jgi:hypothetical protein
MFLLNVTDQVPHPHKTTGELYLFYILKFGFSGSGKGEHGMD